MRKAIGTIGLSLAFIASSGQAQNLMEASRPLPRAAFAVSTEPQQITILSTGDGSLFKRLQLIYKAQHSIDAEFFLLESGRVGRLYMQALAAKAQQGVRVRILIDERLGNTNLNALDAQILNSKGIQVKYYNNELLIHFTKANHRNHRKTLIVDGTDVVMGGRNLGDDYFDLNKEYNMLDQDIAIHGSIVNDIAVSFELFWRSELSQAPKVVPEPQLIHYGYATEREAIEHYLDGGQSAMALFEKEHKEYLKKFQDARQLVMTSLEDQKLLKQISEKGRKSLRSAPHGACNQSYFIADLPGPGPESRVVYDQIRNLISTAKRSVTVESPFFIFDSSKNIFQQELDKGVKIEVITNSLYSSDVEMTIAPFLSSARPLAARGAKIYVYEGYKPPWIESDEEGRKIRWGTHAKTMVIDDDSFLIGSFNMDPRSTKLNAEMVFVCRDKPELTTAMKIENEKRKTITVLLGTNGEPIDGRSIFFKIDKLQKLKFLLMKPISELLKDIL